MLICISRSAEEDLQFAYGECSRIGPFMLMRLTPQIIRNKKSEDEDASKSDDVISARRAALSAIPDKLNSNDVTASGESCDDHLSAALTQYRQDEGSRSTASPVLHR